MCRVRFGPLFHREPFWNLFSSDLFTFSFSGGLSNFLYYCALPESQKPIGNEPSKVLMRIYGQDHSDMQMKFITECVIFTLLSENNRGPRLHGVFPGGRLEEYIPVRHQTNQRQETRETRIYYYETTNYRSFSILNRLDL